MATYLRNEKERKKVKREEEEKNGAYHMTLNLASITAYYGRTRSRNTLPRDRRRRPVDVTAADGFLWAQLHAVQLCLALPHVLLLVRRSTAPAISCGAYHRRYGNR